MAARKSFLNSNRSCCLSIFLHCLHRQHQKQRRHACKVEQVARVDNAARYLHKVVIRGKIRQEAHQLRGQEHKEVPDERKHDADGERHKKRDDLIFGNAGGEQPDGAERRNQEECARVAANHGTKVGAAEDAAGDGVAERGDKQHRAADERGKVLSQHHVDGGNGERQKRFERADALFFGNHAHGKRGHKECERYRQQREEVAQLGAVRQKERVEKQNARKD